MNVNHLMFEMVKFGFVSDVFLATAVILTLYIFSCLEVEDGRSHSSRSMQFSSIKVSCVL